MPVWLAAVHPESMPWLHVLCSSSKARPRVGGRRAWPRTSGPHPSASRRGASSLCPWRRTRRAWRQACAHRAGARGACGRPRGCSTMRSMASSSSGWKMRQQAARAATLAATPMPSPAPMASAWSATRGSRQHGGSARWPRGWPGWVRRTRSLRPWAGDWQRPAADDAASAAQTHNYIRHTCDSTHVKLGTFDRHTLKGTRCSRRRTGKAA